MLAPVTGKITAFQVFNGEFDGLNKPKARFDLIETGSWRKE
jgi:hypothetical protein